MVPGRLRDRVAQPADSRNRLLTNGFTAGGIFRVAFSVWLGASGDEFVRAGRTDPACPDSVVQTVRRNTAGSARGSVWPVLGNAQFYRGPRQHNEHTMAPGSDLPLGNSGETCAE